MEAKIQIRNVVVRQPEHPTAPDDHIPSGNKSRMSAGHGANHHCIMYISLLYRLDAECSAVCRGGGALRAKGYELARVRGSHHVFVKPGVKTFSVPVHHGKVLAIYVRQIEKLP